MQYKGTFHQDFFIVFSPTNFDLSLYHTGDKTVHDFRDCIISNPVCDFKVLPVSQKYFFCFSYYAIALPEMQSFWAMPLLLSTSLLSDIKTTLTA